MFSIKICGVADPADAVAAAEAGADAVGLNFFPGSPRCVTPERASGIVSALPDGVAKVGVFVNCQSSYMQSIRESLSLDFLQLHGDEPPQTLVEMGDAPIVRAFRCRDEGLQPVIDYLDQCRLLGRLPDAVLLDAYAPGQFGGTGQVVDWSLVGQVRDRLGEMKIILAGGLTAENVAEAIATARPDAVDAASGVETAPGVKDHGLIRHFVNAAREGFLRSPAV